MTCIHAERQLSAYVDNELSVERRIALDAHLMTCVSCSASVRTTRRMSRLLQRAGEGLVDVDTLEQVRASSEILLSRVAAEREVARTTGFRRLIEDAHLVWLASAACAVTTICALIVTAVVGSAAVQSPDSLAAMMVALANPGSNANPVRLRSGMAVPQLHQDAMLLTLPDPMPLPGRPSGMTLSVVVTREGTVSSLSVLGVQGTTDPALWVNLVDSAATARFAPAQYGGAPVAVNMVWVVEQVTIRGDAQSEFPVSSHALRSRPAV